LKALFLALVFLAAPAWPAREIPRLSGPVVDEAGLLSRTERDRLANFLMSERPTAQLQVWIVQSLEGEPIENLSIRAVEQWKLGDEKKDNGLLLLVAKDDRRARLEVGRGLEGEIPDVIAGRLKAGQYAEGIVETVENIFSILRGEKSAGSLPADVRRDPPIFIILFFIVMFLLSLFSSGRRRPGFFLGGGWGGSGGFGGRCGRGWSGGGGGFGGGGSSGRW